MQTYLSNTKRYNKMTNLVGTADYREIWVHVKCQSPRISTVIAFGDRERKSLGLSRFRKGLSSNFCDS